MSKIYLAVPYSEMEDISFWAANEIAAQLMLEGHVVFSPISQSHPIALANPVLKGKDWDFWQEQDRPFIEWAEQVVVILIGDKGLDLINKSVGVLAEIEIAKSLKKPIIYRIWNHK